MSRKHPPPHAKPTAADLPAERRRLRWTLGLGFVAAAAIAIGLVFGLGGPRALTAEGRGVLDAYEEIRAALATDDLAKARAAAALMAGKFADRAPTSQPAREIAAATTLDDARLAFVRLSQDAISLARGQAGYFHARCPIQNCPEPCDKCPMSRYGPWVQRTAEVENPYMGRAHLRCGVIQP